MSMKLQTAFRIQSQSKTNPNPECKTNSLAWCIIYTMPLPLIYHSKISVSVNHSQQSKETNIFIMLK